MFKKDNEKESKCRKKKKNLVVESYNNNNIIVQYYWTMGKDIAVETHKKKLCRLEFLRLLFPPSLSLDYVMWKCTYTTVVIVR